MIIRVLIVITILHLFAFVRSNGQCNFSRADKFENVWVVSGSQVICFDKQLKRVGSYSNILLGNPTYLDVLDPFRVLVFYQSSRSIAILNNTVSEISKPILLLDKGLSDASLACRSDKGGFWILDRTSWSILYFDAGFNQTGEKLTPDMAFSGSKPIFMQEKNGVLYLAFQGKGICRFDSYGAQMGDILIKIDNYFSFIDDKIVFPSANKILQFNPNDNKTEGFNAPCECIPVKVHNQFLFFDGNGLVVCKIR